MKKVIIKFLTALCVIAAVVISVNVYAEEKTFSQCSTDGELMQESFNALLQKNIEVSENNDFDNRDELFQTSFMSSYIMPSTGDVKVLVVPIEFNDEKLSETICDDIQELYFSEQDLTNTDLKYEDLSVCDYYKSVSYNKLRLSGTVLPVYSAKENRKYYEAIVDGKRLAAQLVAEAINSYADTIGDLSEYDFNNDGFIDCLHVIWAGDSNGLDIWWAQALRGGVFTLFDGTSMFTFVGIPEERMTLDTCVHETGHLFGLPDNYSGSTCVLPLGCDDLMACNGYHFNALYKYLLDWEDVKILPYEDITQEIELYASDIYNENTFEETRAVMFVTEPEQLPFTEFYIIEYRASESEGYNTSPGIIIWHVNFERTFNDKISFESNCLKPVPKNGEIYVLGKLVFVTQNRYFAGDEFSSETYPSSDFYDNIYTGAYMKVDSTDSEKATIIAGFKDPDLSPPPEILISPPSKKVAKRGDTVTYTVTYKNADAIGEISKTYPDECYILPYVQIDTTGSVDTTTSSHRIYLDEIDPLMTETTQSVWVGSGDGTAGMTIKPRSAYNIGALGGKRYAPSATSETFIIDNTPPEIVLNGSSVITLNVGDEYIEQGAEISDNLDPDIKDKLVIKNSSVNPNKAGTYKVYYTAVDHAGHETKVIRTVNVIGNAINEIQYSTTKLTNRDVVATLIPSIELTEDTELTHTFTENGEHTFILTDLEGNVSEITAKVTWIDKTVSIIEYSTTEPTNKDVTATMIPAVGLTSDMELTHTFTVNGKYTFILKDEEGNLVEETAEVDWIDKIPPTFDIEYSTTEPTNKYIKLKVFPLEAVESIRVFRSWPSWGNVTHVGTSENEEYYELPQNGRYLIEVTDLVGNITKEYIEVTWIDKIPPEIKLNGDSEVTVKVGGEYVEQGAEVTDDLDPDIASKLVIDDSDVNTGTVGTYYVYYDATDHATNKANQVVRTVNVREARTISFVNYDKSILQSEDVALGTLPQYKGETPAKPSDDGYSYRFTGWLPELTEVTEAATYTAQFEAIPREYTVTLNKNGGDCEDLTSYTYGVGATLPEPKKMGYTFGGWYENENYDGEAVTEIKTTDTGDKTYYAKWIANTYTVTLNKNGGECEELTSYTYGVGATLPEPKKTGYTFGGWYENENYDGEAVTEIKTTDTGDKTYYAKWTVNTYTVTLNKNGGECEDLTGYTYGVGATLPEPKKTGYTFGGWFEDANCDGEAVTEIKTTDTGDKTYYARWTVNTYTVTLNKNGGDCEELTSYTYGVGATLPEPKKTGYTFDGWYENENYDGETVVDIKPTDTGDKTYYAKWTANTYTVTLNKNGGDCEELTSYTYGEKTTLPTPTKTGYTFDGWYENENYDGEEVTEIKTTDTGEKTYYAKWTVNTYTVTLNANGGECEELTSYTYGVGATLPEPKKTGYTFGGWYENENYDGEAVTEIKTTDTGDKTYYAKWIANTYTVTLNKNGGECEDLTSYTYGAGATLPEPKKTGYTFGGWYENENYDGEAVVDIKPTDTGDKTYYAKWTKDEPEPEPSDRVEFTRDGGEVTARLIFEKTLPPPENEIRVFAVFSEGGVFRYAELLTVSDMTANFTIPEKYAACDVSLYVWDKNLLPLMDVQKMEAETE